MRKKFSNKWLQSRQPRKQRKYRYNAPMHRRQKMISAHLSKELRKEFKKRAIGIRVNDEVRIMRGKFAKMSGKITEVDLKRLKVFVDCAKRKKASGQEMNIPLDPSNILITKLNLDDRMRKKIISRKSEKK
ncbi:MAG TPA: 50S ribosomal protein L24 [archaeon]|nr:50S ribosomal protein L24 [archaeon]